MVKTIDVLGFPHAYELSAPTDNPFVLVFVHGWLLSRAYWQPVIEQLTPHYQCLTYDLRGFGDSRQDIKIQATAASVGEELNVSLSSPILETVGVTANGTTIDRLVERPDAVADCSEYTPAAYARNLIHLLQGLNINQAWLVGHSLGGSIALWAADLAPEMIAGVICVNAGGGIYLKEEFERFRAAGEQLVKFRPRWLACCPLLDVLLTRMNVAHPIARKWGRQRLLDLLSADLSAALGSLLDSTTEDEVHRLPQVVSRLQQPIHFVAGENDMVMEPKYVRHLASFHPSFEFCGENVSEISNCGHLAMVEQPEAVAAEIRSILAKHGCV